MNKLIHYAIELYLKDPLQFIGLVILLAYVIFTYKLWRESVKQTTLKLMPLPALYVRERGNDRKIRIRNNGEKPMYVLSIEDFNIYVTGAGDIVTLKLNMPSPDVVIADEERDLACKTFINNEEVSSFLYQHNLDPRYANMNIPLRVYFRDARGTIYYMRFALGTGELNTIGYPKKISKIRYWCQPRLIQGRDKLIGPIRAWWHKHKNESTEPSE